MRSGGPLGIVLLLAAPLLAGCVDVGGADEARLAAAPGATPWETGLRDTHPTPAHVLTRADADRRVALSPPGAPEWAAFDALMVSFMEAHLVGAAQLAVMQDGLLLYERGYGHVDPEGTSPANETTMFRLASVTKPVTHALVMLQVEEGLYALEDPVFCVPPEPKPGCRLPIAPHPAHPIVDPRVADVTVGQLLDHTAGWGRSTDWMYRGPGTWDMAATLGVDLPLPAWRAAQYLMGEELADDPGSRTWYCNICYMLAGLVAENATGATLQALYDAYLFRPLEVEGEIELGRALPEDRNPREPNYQCGSSKRESAYERDAEVCGADGGFSTEIVSSAGGLVATAAAVAAVYEAYPDGAPTSTMRYFGVDAYEPAYDKRAHGGLLDGTSTYSGIVTDKPGLAGTIQYVILFNSHVPGTRCVDQELPAFGTLATGCPISYFEDAIMQAAIARGALERVA